MNLPAIGWFNKQGTGSRACACGTWAQHWVNHSGKAWPTFCSVLGCFNTPILGGHVANAAVAGERIVPLCSECNSRSGSFSLNDGIHLPSANQAETCAKRTVARIGF